MGLGEHVRRTLCGRRGIVALAGAVVVAAACDDSSADSLPDGSTDASIGLDAADVGDGDGDADVVDASHDDGLDGGDTDADASNDGPLVAEAGKPNCGVTRKFTIQYSNAVSKITADSSIIYDPNLFKDGVLDTTCNPAMTFNHVIGYGSVEITGCVDNCGAYVSSEAAVATVVYGENACNYFQTEPEAYKLIADVAVFRPPCDK